jgi:lipopolysaccharide transport system ATP-binding protein
MSDTAIRVEHLGKKYRITHQQHGGKRYKALRDVLSESFKSFFSKSSSPELSNSKTEDFWAVNDVSFEINAGEVIGIIGRNGAGKSTLLKLLSRITEPTRGRIEIEGSVASLLEVGTGFHPELTGRENIQLNGAILGMRSAEIKRKFDEIVAFAEVEKFLDTPVKRYSSGMYVRLAFAVAAHLEPEILIVDEVLAVGDAQFQKKCLGKMHDVSTKEGRTVLFVSHSMPTISSLCQRTFLMAAGRMIQSGPTKDVIAAYYGQTETSSSVFDPAVHGRSVGDEFCRLLRAEVLDENEKPAIEIDINRPLKIRLRYRILRQNRLTFFPNFHFFRADGICAFVVHAPGRPESAEGDYQADCEIPADFLNEGTYFVEIVVSSYEPTVTVHADERSALMFNVRDPIEGVTTRAGFAGAIPGAVRPALKWKIGKIP